MRVRSTRDRMSSLSKTWRRWVFTAWGETNSLSAIPRLVQPAAARRATWSSAAVNDSHPSFGRSSDRTGGSCYGRHTGIEFVSVRGELGDGLRELLIAGREGHPDQQRIVGGLHREEREQ